jgi:Flp pilus assembly protein TadD
MLSIDARPFVREQAALHTNRAVELERAGRYAEAVAAYRESLRNDPDDVRVHVRLGLLLRGLGRDDEANHVFAAALALTAPSGAVPRK